MVQHDTVLVYHGESMKGTFRPCDRLSIEPVAMADLHPGDVVVYRKGQEPMGGAQPANGGHVERTIVHRVVAIMFSGAIVCGDNNALNDVELVLEPHIVGRVTHFRRGGKDRRVRGGLLGLQRARIAFQLRRLPLKVWQGVRALIRAALQAPYRWLRRSQIVRTIWKPAITQITVQTAAGPLVKYIHRGRTVVEWWPEHGQFQAVRPYDLIIFPPDRTESQLDSEQKHLNDS